METPNQLHAQAAALLGETQEVLAREIAERRLEPMTTGSRDSAIMEQDALDQLVQLRQALATDSTDLFTDYVGWLKIVRCSQGESEGEFRMDLEATRDVLRQRLQPVQLGQLAAEYVEHSLQQLSGLPTAAPTGIETGHPLADLTHEYIELLIAGDRHAASRLVMAAVESGTPVKDIYLHVFQPSQHEIGRRWQNNEVSVGQEHLCTAATQMIMSQLYPYIFSTDKNGRSLVATCVGGDLHEIGIRMVADFFEIAGWDTFYLGANTPSEAVVQAVTEHQVDVLGISATMSYHVQSVQQLIRAVRRAPNCSQVVIMVGGYPFQLDPDLWHKIGADATAADAQDAIATANRLVKEPA